MVLCEFPGKQIGDKIEFLARYNYVAITPKNKNKYDILLLNIGINDLVMWFIHVYFQLGNRLLNWEAAQILGTHAITLLYSTSITAAFAAVYIIDNNI